MKKKSPRTARDETGDATLRRATIFAVATGPAAAALAVIRLSGPDSGPALKALTGAAPPPARALGLRRLVDPESGAALDRGLVAWFPGPASVTGEDVVELHLHGGRAPAMAVSACLAALPGLRPAEPGEFTRRAFAAGKLDLTQAEALADLVAAETDAQRTQALRQMDGALGALYEGWRARLIGATAQVEAALDFADEDQPAGGLDAARRDLLSLRTEIADHLADGRRGEILRDGFEITLIGPPNVGKSSLLNRLAGRDAAIVARTPGTTRDPIEVRMDLGGLPVTLVDTAGIRDLDTATTTATTTTATATDDLDPVEVEGIRRALARAERADLAVIVVDASADAPPLSAPNGVAALIAVNKCDLAPAPAALPGGVPAFELSAKTGAGLDDFVAALEAAAAAALAGGATAPLTRVRHRRALEDCVEALDRVAAGATMELTMEPTMELVAEDLRHAAQALGRITGRVDVEDVLDAIFRDFCIGK